MKKIITNALCAAHSHIRKGQFQGHLRRAKKTAEKISKFAQKQLAHVEFYPQWK